MIDAHSTAPLTAALFSSENGCDQNGTRWGVSFHLVRQHSFFLARSNHGAAIASATANHSQIGIPRSHRLPCPQEQGTSLCR
jgi:hypothetical protein